MSEPMVLRSVTVREVMDDEGSLSLEIEDEGDLTAWDRFGLLAAGLQSVKLDLAAVWNNDDD